jgi:hypothetical protein
MNLEIWTPKLYVYIPTLFGDTEFVIIKKFIEIFQCS